MKSKVRLYQDRVDSIRQQLQEIELAIRIHQLKFEKDPKNWGYVAEIGAVDIQLSTIKGFINDNKYQP